MPSYLEDDYGSSRSYTEVRLKLIEEVRRQPRIYSEKRLPTALIDRFFPHIARSLGYRRESTFVAFPKLPQGLFPNPTAFK